MSEDSPNNWSNISAKSRQTTRCYTCCSKKNGICAAVYCKICISISSVCGLPLQKKTTNWEVFITTLHMPCKPRDTMCKSDVKYYNLLHQHLQLAATCSTLTYSSYLISTITNSSILIDLSLWALHWDMGFHMFHLTCQKKTPLAAPEDDTQSSTNPALQAPREWFHISRFQLTESTPILEPRKKPSYFPLPSLKLT